MFNSYFTSKAIQYYLGVLFVVNLVFFNHSMDLIWWVFGIVAVVGFFKGTQNLIKKWDGLPEKTYIKKLFQTALIIRIVYVTVMYFFYTYMNGNPFEFNAGDVGFYHSIAEFGADCLWDGKFDLTTQIWTQDSRIDISDMGYPIYLSIIYALTAKSIFVARIIKAIWSAWMCVLIYRLATRNFGEQVGRMAGIFVMFMPNFIYYTALHLKETEMVFLTVFFIERADFLMRGRDFSFKTIFPIMLIAGTLFMFRTALAASAVFALFTAVFLTSKRVLKMEKKIVLTLWVFVTIGYFIGGTVATEIQSLWEARNGVKEAGFTEMETRKGGNAYVKYIAGVSFAPLIFVVPLPTLVNIEEQRNQQLAHGGYYIKNTLAFFVILAFYYVIKEKRWREYLLLGSFIIGYLVVISMTRFAASERFHLPALPFLLIIAAYGVTLVNSKQKKLYNSWLVLIFVIIVAWSWFKLAGRGLA